MSELLQFFKKNKVKKENVKYQATKSLTDEKGEPLFWELRPLDTETYNNLMDMCMQEVPIKGKKNAYRTKFNTTMYLKKMVCATVVYPNLHNKELQDSYGVMSAEELISAMVDNASEYAELITFVESLNNFEDMEDRVAKLKN